MSKLERLNARVAKLLTVAVQEVLEVVKDTVSEYQEKAARTQRENESLKRRLQELQDKITREAASASQSATASLPEDKEDTEKHEQDLSLTVSLISELSHTEQNQISNHEPDHYVKQESKQQGCCSSTESQNEYSLAQTSVEPCQVQSEELTHITEEAATVHTLHSTSSDISVDSPNNAGTSHSNTVLGVNLPAIKSELEPIDCAPSELPSLQEHYSGCVDLSSNSSCHNTTESEGLQVSTGPYGIVFVHSSNALSRKYGLAKAERAAFDGRKNRREHFRRDDPHVCFVCGKTFSRVGNLRIHQRCHTGEKPYGCLQCGRRFSQAGDLSKHKRVHTGEKPYYCNQCGKSFSRGENLKRHQKIHVGERLQLQQVWREQQ